MIIIAFSDVHGNSDALEVFLNEIKHEKYDKINYDTNLRRQLCQKVQA